MGPADSGRQSPGHGARGRPTAHFQERTMLPIPVSPPRRRWLTTVLRPAAIAMVLAILGGSVAEASPIRTAFKNISPIARAGVSIRNGDFITLQATLHDGARGIPNQEIKFYVTINRTQVLVGRARTNANGTATVTSRIFVPGLAGRNWVPVSWVPEFRGTSQYRAAQNNLLGGGFRVYP
jgi:hypothetical protein